MGFLEPGQTGIVRPISPWRSASGPELRQEPRRGSAGIDLRRAPAQNSPRRSTSAGRGRKDFRGRHRLFKRSFMKPGLLKSPRVIEWLRGKEPAWTLLTFQGWCALHGKPSETGCAPSLSGDTSSTRALNATFLFRIGPETKPTTTGNLTRAFVAEMVAAFLLPDSDPVKALVRRIVANEPDFTPLHAVRIFCDRAKLVCVEGRQSRLTKKAQTLVAKGNVGKLNRLLFDAAVLEHEPRLFRRLSLGSLAGACPSPRTTGKSPTISFACARPRDWRAGGRAGRVGSDFEARILRVLAWFDLLEAESTPDENWS